MVVVVDPTSWPRFFIGAAVDPAGRPCFRAVVGLTIGLCGADGLAIDGAILMGADVAVGFSRLSL